jgi:PAS domain S-box-containing protein
MQSTINRNQETTSNYQSFFDKVDDFLFVVSKEGKLLEINETALQRLGYKKNELIGQSLLKIHPENRHAEATEIINSIVNGEEKLCLIPLITRDGKIIPVETKAILGMWNNQQVVFGVSKDVSQLAWSEEKLSKVFHSNPAICGIIDLHTDRFLEVNKTFYQKLAFSEQQVENSNASKLLGLSKDLISSTIKELQESKKVESFDLDILTASGKRVPVWGFGETIVLDGKKYLYAVAIDISEKKEAEKKILRSEKALKKIIKNTMGKGGQTFFNALVKSLVQIANADYVYIAESISDNEIKTISLYHKNERLDDLSYLLKGTPCENVINKKTCIYTHDVAKLFPKDLLLQEMKVEAYIGTPVFSHTGKGIGIIVSLFRQPLTETFFIKSVFEICSASVGSEMERYQTNLKVKENEEILNKIFDHAPVIMMLLDQNSQVIKINRTTSETILGKNKVIGNYSCKNVFNCIGESNETIGIGSSELCKNCVISITLAETLKSGKEVLKKEADVITLQGTEIGLRTYSISSSLVEKGENSKVLLTFDDITERKRIEEELLLSKEKSVYNEKRYRLLSNLTFEGIMLHQNRKILDANRALSKMTGYSYAELIGQDSMSFIFPLEYENYFKEKMTEEYSLPYETEIIDKNGKQFPVEIESRYFKQNKQRIRVTSIRDITERKQGEKKILKAIMNTEERERARFAQELHDGLGPILSNVRMYFQWLAEEDDNKQFVFEKGNLSLTNAFSTLHEISNNLSPHILHNFGLVHAVNNFVENIVSKKIRFKLKTNIETKRFPGELEITLYRVVNELINNTLKYSGANKISLFIFEENDLVKLNYTDNGKGFDVNRKLKKGKGFGLLNIKNRIKTIQGNFSLKSEPNQGVRVEISVPMNANNVY